MYQREVTEKYTEKNLDMTKLLLLQRRANIFRLSLAANPQEFDAKGESTRTTRLHDTLSVP